MKGVKVMIKLAKQTSSRMRGQTISGANAKAPHPA
jgi:hypothetical protein